MTKKLYQIIPGKAIIQHSPQGLSWLRDFLVKVLLRKFGSAISEMNSEITSEMFSEVISEIVHIQVFLDCALRG